MIRVLRAAAAASLLMAATATAQITVGTMGSWTFPESVAPFGIPQTQTYGQTITVPANAAVLQSFSFRVMTPSALAFRGEVYAWDGTKATGPCLYESAATVSPDGNLFQLITFHTGGVTVTPGATYVLFLTTSRDNAGHSGSGSVAGMFDAYAGGSLYVLDNGTDTGMWTSTSWTSTAADLAFTAVFAGAPTAVPTLSEWALILLAGGLVLVAVAAMKRYSGAPGSPLNPGS